MGIIQMFCPITSLDKHVKSAKWHTSAQVARADQESMKALVIIGLQWEASKWPLSNCNFIAWNQSNR